MSRRRSSAGLVFAATLLLAACSREPAIELGVRGRLASCELKGTRFEHAPFEDWATIYHVTVNSVINDDLDGLSKHSCLLDGATSRPAARTPLRELAKDLPPWKVPSSLSSLSQDDLPAVLLEYLRTYECAMLEYRESSWLTVSKETTNRGEYNTKIEEIRAKVQRETAIARTSLNRALAVLSGLHRFELLAIDTTCLLRISLDIRNNFALLAEAGACLPRAQDGQQSLRDLTIEPY